MPFLLWAATTGIAVGAFLGALLGSLCCQAFGSELPPRAVQYAPVLASTQEVNWPTAPTPWTLAGLVEQETCPSLKHRQCWNPRSELRTYREYGFGLGQITITKRFNEFNELKRKYASLQDWEWNARFDPAYQLTAIVEMTHNLWNHVPPSNSDEDRWAFTLCSYNGGLSGLLQDRRYCANSSHCDTTKWFNNIETHSLKSKAPQRAYGGQSFYGINRGYVRNVLLLRRGRYKTFWPANPPPTPVAEPNKWWDWISKNLIGDLS